MVGILQVGDRSVGQRPLSVFISPFHLAGQARVAVSVYRDIDTTRVEIVGEIANE
jgi:hypothetical protein